MAWGRGAFIEPHPMSAEPLHLSASLKLGNHFALRASWAVARVLSTREGDLVQEPWTACPTLG
jgi:hypothetical protein